MTSTQVYCCSICKEDLGAATAKLQDNGSRPLVTTKCGHLFHVQCLNKAFSGTRSGAWDPKQCPQCKTSLIVGTDVIRIFPCQAVVPDVVPGPTVEQLIDRVKLLQGQITELSTRLEVSFLKNRESEKMLAQSRKEIDSLNWKLDKKTQQLTEVSSQAQMLSIENSKLSNTVVSLSNNLMDNRMMPMPHHHGPPPFMRPPQFPPRQFQQHGYPPPPPPPHLVRMPNNGNYGLPRYPYPNQSYMSRPPFRKPQANNSNMHLVLTNCNNSSSRENINSGTESPESGHSIIEQNSNRQNREEKILNEENVRNNNFETRDLNSNALDNSGNNVIKPPQAPINWKYQCNKCNLSWGTLSREQPQHNFCHGCRKIVNPHAQMP